MADPDGKVNIWHIPTKKGIRVYSVDARELLRQDEYTERNPETGLVDETVAPPSHGPPNLEDWTVRDLEKLMRDRFNERRNTSKYPRKSDVIRHIEELYKLEEQHIEQHQELEAMDEVVLEDDGIE